MTTTTRERFTQKFWIVSEVDCYWDLEELFSFIETIEKEAEDRMKEKFTKLVKEKTVFPRSSLLMRDELLDFISSL